MARPSTTIELAPRDYDEPTDWTFTVFKVKKTDVPDYRHDIYEMLVDGPRPLNFEVSDAGDYWEVAPLAYRSEADTSNPGESLADFLAFAFGEHPRDIVIEGNSAFFYIKTPIPGQASQATDVFSTEFIGVLDTRQMGVKVIARMGPDEPYLERDHTGSRSSDSRQQDLLLAPVQEQASSQPDAPPSPAPTRGKPAARTAPPRSRSGVLSRLRASWNQRGQQR